MDRCRTIDVPIIEFFSVNVNLKARITRLIRQILHNETQVHGLVQMLSKVTMFSLCDHLFGGVNKCSVVFEVFIGQQVACQLITTG
ncbi:hypothetical protein EA58_20430 [Photobacterium galatheae]|uniref:Uncharacterized protein n=1 Tax=Photobacterium galatheae TaxID=1654360 RepID=A0A066RH98_9GAMM|nr:hypothetical protein EA58_20430 [Photobacterium galatheae]